MHAEFGLARRPLRWCALLLLCSAGFSIAAEPDVHARRAAFLLDPDPQSAAAAWDELLKHGDLDDLQAPYDAAAALYPLDSLDPDACAVQAPLIEAALHKNSLAAPALLALSMCAERAGDTQRATHWHRALDAWMRRAFAEGRGRSVQRPLQILSITDVDTLEIAVGRSLSGRVWQWQGNDASGGLVLRAGWTGAAPREIELFFELGGAERAMQSRDEPVDANTPWARSNFNQTLVQQLTDYDQSVEGFAQLQQWSSLKSRQRARALAAAGDPALAFAILRRCLTSKDAVDCVEADIDPLLDHDDHRDALVLRGLLLQQSLATSPVRSNAAATLFAALVKRVGEDAALHQVWTDFRMVGQLHRLPAQVAELTRRRAAAGDGRSLYRLARHPLNPSDQSLAQTRLQQAAGAGNPAAQFRRALQVQKGDAAGAAALLNKAAAQGHRGARLAQLKQQYFQTSDSETRAELVESAIALVRLRDHGSMLWLARHYNRLEPPQAAASYRWALGALDSSSRPTLAAAMRLLLKHKVAGQPALATLYLGGVLQRLMPGDEQSQRWCTHTNLAQACLYLFDQKIRQIGRQALPSAEDLRWLERAAQLGNRDALRRLGESLLSGKYGVRDGKRGLGLLDRATGMGDSDGQNAAAWVRCVSTEDDVYQPALGLNLITHLLGEVQSTAYSDTLAACQAANGDFEAAIATQREVVERVQAGLGRSLAADDGMVLRQRLYAAGKAYRSDSD